MAVGAGAKPLRGGGHRGGIEQRNSWNVALLPGETPFEDESGIAQPSHSRVAFERIVSQSQFEILEEAELQQTVHILVAVGQFKAGFEFEDAALHGFTGGSDGRAVGDGGDALVFVVGSRGGW